MRRRVVVTGTGTEIGKTHTTCALLGAARGPALGLKPVESGVEDGGDGADANALRRASHPMFHVKHSPTPYLFRDPVSPHLAARREGRRIDLRRILAYVENAPREALPLFVELPGGIFSPLTEAILNADLVRLLAPDALLLVAPDRLGVLHDVLATLRALQPADPPVTAIALVCPATPDSSTGTNAAELRLLGTPSVFELPRAPVEELAASAALRRLYAELVDTRVT
jgi:dethiobiotin synthetase